MTNVPQDRAYTRDHEWVRRDGQRAVVGLTDYAQRQLGDIVFVDLPDAGARFDAGQPLGTVESVKAVSEIYMPVAGTVREPNPELAEMPESLNDDPYGDGWLVEIEVTDAAAFDGLLSAEEYVAYLADGGE